MCGIFMCLLAKQINLDDYKSLFDQLIKRGPDFNQLIEEFNLGPFKACLFSSVLNIRGDQLIEQPIIKNNDFLQFNGELYELENNLEFDNSIENDGLYLMHKLIDCEDEQSILNLISQLRGEFSFIYFSSRLKALYFGRDYFGRRSLCWNIDSKLFLGESIESNDLNKLRESNDFEQLNDSFDLHQLNNHNFCISSNAFYNDQNVWTEIPANGVYKLSLNEKDDYFNQLKLIQWQTKNTDTLPILFSPITNSFNFDLANLDLNEDEMMLDYELQFIEILRKSVQNRVLKQNFKCKNCSSNRLDNETTCNHSCLAILFSGGLDSTILALISNEFMPKHLPIDLINLAFNSNAPDRLTGWSSYLELKRIAPDRQWNFIAVNRSAEQLFDYRERLIKKIIYPLNTVLDDSIGCAIYFASTGQGKLIKDGELIVENLNAQDSIDANANAQDMNKILNQYHQIDYETTSKILILGQGADEQLAGYARHRTTFRIGSWSALQKELNLDIKRISYRNLGRDDRMISINGREARYPFLDENVVSFLNKLPTNIKCNLNLAKGEGDKRLLRLVGQKLGLNECCRYEKRAIQFGSRIAKLENKKEKAAHISRGLI